MNPDRPMPEATDVSRPFWDGLREHTIRIQYSPSLQQYVFYPRLVSPRTLEDDLEWREIDGAGTLYTYTITDRPTASFFADEVPQKLAIVQWDVGPRISTELVEVDPDDIEVGMRVRPVFCDYSEAGVTLLRYAPA